jgi:hypothetical protein
MSIDGTRTLSCGEVSVDPEVDTRKSNKCGDRINAEKGKEDEQRRKRKEISSGGK